MPIDRGGLVSRVARIARTAQAVKMATLVSQAILCFLALFALLLFIDYRFRWNATAPRLLISITWYAAIFFPIIHCFKSGLVRAISLVDAADSIERALKLKPGYLSSIISFEVNAASSRGLSQSLIELETRRAEVNMRDLPFESALRLREGILWSMAFLVVCSFVAFFGAQNPRLLGIAFQRMAFPWSDANWPQKVQLDFVGLPEVVPEGASWEAQVINRKGALPANVWLTIRGIGFDEGVRMAMHTQQNIANFKLTPESDIELRATAGDDDSMPWKRVRIATAPKLEKASFEIEPPTYSEIEPSIVASQTVQVLAGSKIRLRGSFTQEVRSAELARLRWTSDSNSEDVQKHQSRPPAYSQTESTAPSEIGPIDTASAIPTPFDGQLHLLEDRKSFVVESESGAAWVARQSVSFSFRWKGREGLTVESESEWEIQVQADRAPIALLIEPEKNVHATNRAKIRLSFSAADDFALESVRLQWITKNHPREDSMSIDLNPDKSPLGREYSKTLDWNIPSQLSLNPGDELTFWISAVDRIGQVGESEKRTVRIQSPEELRKSVLALQNSLVSTLRRSLEHQKKSNAQFLKAKALGMQAIADSNDLAALNEFLASMENQEAAADGVSGGTDSALALAEEAMRQWITAGLDSDPQLQRTEALARRFQEMRSNPFEKVIAELRALQESRRDGSPIDTSLVESIEQRQEALQKDLTGLIRELGGEASFQEVRNQVEAFAQQQSNLAERTESNARDSLDPSKQQTAAQNRMQLSTEQNEMARRFEAFQRELASERKQGTDPSESDEKISALQKTLESSAVFDLMREAGGMIQSSQLGQAQLLQNKIAQELRQSVEDRSPKNPSSPMTDDREDFQKFFERIFEDQASLTKKIDSPAEDSKLNSKDARTSRERAIELVREQQRIRDQLEGFSPTSSESQSLVWATKLIGDEMRKVEASLERMQWKPNALRHAASARDRLAAIVAAFKRPSRASENEEDQGPNGQNEEEKRKPSPLSLASLLLLRDIQQSLQMRTQEIYENAEQQGASKLSAEQWLEANAIAHQQSELAEQIQRIIDAMQQPAPSTRKENGDE